MEILNSILDSLARPRIRIRTRNFAAFQLCGYTGLMLAVLITPMLVTRLDLSHTVLVGILAVAVLTFLALVMATKIITGEEKIIYYHHEIAVMVMAAVLLWLLGQPILPYLDVAILGIGIFLACGRVGCLMVGCCHGRPFRWGACYRAEHAAVGFSPYLVGVRLFPIQAVESFWVLCIVIVGVTFVLRGYPAGAALAWYVVAYDLGRFWFEFLRGDPDRPYYRGFSQPQWISIILLFGIVWSELFGLLPFQAWHIGITGFVSFTMLAVSLKRRLEKSDKHHLLHPRHIKEVAEAVELVSSRETERVAVTLQSSISEHIHIACTSLGVQVSASKIQGAAGDVYHYALSYRNGALSKKIENKLADLILQLSHPYSSYELIKGERGVLHLLIHPVSR